MTEKVKYVICFYHPRTDSIQHRTYHKCTLEKAVEKFHAAGFDHIRKIEKISTVDVTDEWEESP